MSKERLEEIEGRVLKNKAHYKKIDTEESYWAYSYELSDKDYHYLIGQAERVQELEEEYKVRRVEYLEEHIDRLEQQNKRYREAIDYVTSAKLDQYRNAENMLNDFKYVINKTLERESE